MQNADGMINLSTVIVQRTYRWILRLGKVHNFRTY